MSGREEIEKMEEKQTVNADASAVEEVRDIAKSYYDSATTQVQEQAERFFKSMDLDGNGEINLVEFLSFMREEGHYKQVRDSTFFEMLDTSGRGTLAFMDVITLYYIIKSGRPFCDSCSHFIPGTFFSCVECFNHPGDSFSVCRTCHKSKSYDHNHNALFLDNFTLLQATKPHLPITTTTTQEAAHTEPTELLSSTQQPLLSGKDDFVSTSTSEKKHVNSEAANTEPTGISATAKTQQPLSLGKGDSASSSTSKNGDMKSKKSPSVTPVKSVAKTSTPSTHIKSSLDLDQNAIVPATKPAASISSSTSTSTSKNDDIDLTGYMTSELNRLVLEQTPSQSPSSPVNQLPSVNVTRIESTISTPNTLLDQSRQNQHAIVLATQPVSWKKVASVALKALDAMAVIGNVAGVVSACTIM